MNAEVNVALCGLSMRDERMVQMVLTQARGVRTRHSFGIVDPVNASVVDVIVVDEQSSFGMEQLLRLQARFVDALPIFICDDVTAGPGRFRLSRRSLLVELLRSIDAAAQCVARTRNARQRDTPVLAATLGLATPASVATALSAAQAEKAPPLMALIVDDSAVVRTQMQFALLKAGIWSTLAANAEEAIAHSRHRHFDLILLDVVMPGMDGYQLCRELLRNPYTRTSPVLMLTSRSSQFDRARGALAGCASYLVKPVEPEGFYRVVDKVLMRSFHNDRQQLVDRGYRQQGSVQGNPGPLMAS